MGGYKRTLDDDTWRHENWVGVHFGIGRDGSIDQYTNIFDASWGNGVSGDYRLFDRSNTRLRTLEAYGQWLPVTYAGTRAYALISGSINVINSHCITIEHEDENNQSQPWTDAQIESSVRVKEWCLQELASAGMPMEEGDEMLVGHFQIDPINRAHCPGPAWPRARILEDLMGVSQEKFNELAGIVWNHALQINEFGRAFFPLARDFYTNQQQDAEQLARIQRLEQQLNDLSKFVKP
jgi:N-acetyl-anhydromuramyl-L-alanine amidase AmpD